MIDSFKEKRWCCYSNGTSQNVISECSYILILQIFWANFKPTEIGTENPKHPNMLCSLNYLLLATVNRDRIGTENPCVLGPVHGPQALMLSISVISGYDK